MSLLDKNKLFFGLIHYVLSEQKNVDWVLKTSINELTGVDLSLSNATYKSDDLIDNVIDFIYDVKPYHAQFSKFIEKFSTDENIKIQTKDSLDETIKVRYDALTGDVSNPINLYLNNYTFHYWGIIETPIVWGTQRVYNEGDLIIANNEYYKIIKRYVPESEEFVYNYEYMIKMPSEVYTESSTPTVSDEVYEFKDEISEIIGYSITEYISSEKMIKVNGIKYKLENTKEIFTHNNVVDLCNTHKANRLCLTGLSEINNYRTIQFYVNDDNYSEYKTLYVLNDEFKEDINVYQLVTNIKTYDKYQNVTSNILTHKMVNIGTIKSIETDDEGLEYLKLVVDVTLSDKQHKEFTYTNFYIEEGEYKLYPLYSISEPNNDRIKDALNMNFKGITVDGHVFKIANYGYDEYNYDSTKYDSPTTEIDYCMVVSKEIYESQSYNRIFVEENQKIFSIENLSRTSLNVKEKNHLTGETVTLTTDDYSLDKNGISLYKPLKAYDELYISDANNVLIYYSQPFKEDLSETLRKEMVELDTTVKLRIMYNDFSINQIYVHKEDIKGNKKLLSATKGDYIINGDYIEVSGLNENEHIIISNYDYTYLYDKIYSYEDTIGRSNNVITLDGDNFLRPYYEENRPDEMIASHPIDGVIMLQNYIKNEKNKGSNIVKTDFKNTCSCMSIVLPSEMKIESFVTNEKGITEQIVLNSTSKITDKGVGKIIVLHKINDNYFPSEIIEYQKIEDNKLIGIKRARNGSPLYISVDGDKTYNELLSVGDYVYPANDDLWVETNNTTLLPTCTLTINPTPNDAIVTLIANNYVQQGNSISVLAGTKVKWEVTKDGYEGQGGSQMLTDDEIKNATLQEIMEINDYWYDYSDGKNLILKQYTGKDETITTPNLENN